MNLPSDVSRCVGKSVPFGHTYSDPECKDCARGKQTTHVQYQPWMGPVEFDESCQYKITQEDLK